ncbi:MAG: hypothetical protein JWQ57_4375 [Mucilaginibacter sp.]|nr:hypothetical protein [Mucilaginibacter sp.]
MQAAINLKPECWVRLLALRFNLMLKYYDEGAVAAPFLFSIIGNLLKMFHVILTKP